MVKRYSITANKEIRIKLSSKEILSIDDISRQYTNFPEFLVKPNYIKHNSMYYTLPKEISLVDFLKEPISIKQLFSIIESIIKVISWIKENDYFEDCLIKDLDFVFINKKNKTVKMVYIPVSDKRRKIDTIEFIILITQSVIVTTNNEQEIINHFFDFLKSQARFNAEQTIKFIRNCSFNYCNKSEEDDDKTDMMDEESSSSFIDDDETIMDDDETIFEEDFSFSEPKDSINKVSPILKRLSTGEDIYINKSVFRIGKDSSVVDYYVDNPAISRSHADIIIKDNRCFIMDLKSKNKTYLNGTALLINKEYEIQNDDLIKLANEEFIFKV